MRRHDGFTLIELMMVIAIIATLTAIMLPVYQDYVARTQLTSGLAEINAGKSTFEALLVANNVTTFDVDSLGLITESARCSISMSPSASNGFIRCTLKGNPRLAGSTIDIVRDSTGRWNCVVANTIDEKYKPTDCR